MVLAYWFRHQFTFQNACCAPLVRRSSGTAGAPFQSLLVLPTGMDSILLGCLVLLGQKLRSSWSEIPHAVGGGLALLVGWPTCQ